MNSESNDVLSLSVDRNDPKWLGLPEAKKAIGLERAAVLERYNSFADPTQDELARAMKDLGLGRTRFYALLKSWKRDRRLHELVPHGERNFKGDTAKGISSNRGIAESTAVPIPFNKTNTPEKFSLNLKSDSGVIANRFGEYLVADHARPDFFLQSERGIFRPEVTVIIDLFTTVVVGYDLHFGEPTPEAVRRAMLDAIERADRLAPKTGKVVPTVLLPIDWKPHWLSLVEEIESAGAIVSVRRSAKLHRGHVTRKLIGEHLDGIRLLSRKPRYNLQLSKPNASRHAILSMVEAQIVLDGAIRTRNNRLIDGAWPSRLKLAPSWLNK